MENTNNAPDSRDDLYRSEAARLAPAIHAFHNKVSTLRAINMTAAIFPTLAVAVATLTTNVVPVAETMLTTSVLLAGSVQFSRWQKAQLKKAFDTIWNGAEETTRPYLLGFLKNTFEKHIGKSSNVLGREDFNAQDRPVLMTLAGTAIIGGVYLPLAPIMFFTGVQTREFGDSAKIMSAANYTKQYYHALQNNGPA